MDRNEQLQVVLRMLSRERLSIDEVIEGKTCFLSHLGAQPRLVPGPWIGHRDLLYALALANLSPTQRTSLARAVLAEHGREFGVGRLVLETHPSGLPFGGSSLLMAPRSGGVTCLYTHSLAPSAVARPCDWMLLRAHPAWALDDPPPVVHSKSLETLVALEAQTLVLVDTAVTARVIWQAVKDRVELGAHPRFAPHLDDLHSDASVLLWPHDALDGAGLRRRRFKTVVAVDAPEAVLQQTRDWARDAGDGAEIAQVTSPDRADREALLQYWRSCGEPHILLRGDPGWSQAALTWLADAGADVQVQGEGTQLGLF